MSALTAKAVSECVKACLFKDGELIGSLPPAHAVLAEGVQQRFGFHPERLAAARPQVKAMLAELPEPFLEAGEPKGLSEGGWSFLQACMRRDGQLWGEHWNIDELLALGLASGLVSFCVPRDMWHILPGGMPYFTVSREVLA